MAGRTTRWAFPGASLVQVPMSMSTSRVQGLPPGFEAFFSTVGPLLNLACELTPDLIKIALSEFWSDLTVSKPTWGDLACTLGRPCMPVAWPTTLLLPSTHRHDLPTKQPVRHALARFVQNRWLIVE